MANYVFTDEAQEHINNIRSYTRNKWGKQQAKNYLSALRLILGQLAENPLMGTQRFSDIDDGIYSFPHSSHMIYYRTQKNLLIVIAVLHQNMAPENHVNRIVEIK